MIPTIGKDFNRLIDRFHTDGLYMWEFYCKLSFCNAFRISDVPTLVWEDTLDKEFLDKIEQKTKKGQLA